MKKYYKYTITSLEDLVETIKKFNFNEAPLTLSELKEKFDKRLISVSFFLTEDSLTASINYDTHNDYVNIHRSLFEIMSKYVITKNYNFSYKIHVNNNYDKDFLNSIAIVYNFILKINKCDSSFKNNYLFNYNINKSLIIVNDITTEYENYKDISIEDFHEIILIFYNLGKI